MLNITFAGTMESIGNYMFKDCTGFSGTLEIPSSITNVGLYAFANCKGISAVDIQHANVKLGAGAFQGCTSMTSLTIPVVINVVGSDSNPIFDGCTGLTSISLTGNGNSGDYSATSGNNNYYLKTPWYFSRNNTISLSIGSGVTGIGANMFRDCTGIYGTSGSLILSAPLASVGNYAFAGISKVNTLEINSSSISIGEGAFQGCASIHSLTIPITMNAVGYENAPIFGGCTGLTSLRFIGSGAGMVYSEKASSTCYLSTPWYNATSAFTVSFADTITSIGANMFRDNEMLDDNIIAPSITSIGTNAF
ncbi:MAG: leucine-rich repeat protein, partial [Candidatus Methanomethylophilaceae archaeon]|nr:leucine-rich repeat protein [Candidatus Methanomethylophilaceae archaeon]